MKPIIKYSDKFLNSISWFMKVGGITLFPYIIFREVYEFAYYKEKAIRHETTHIKQQGELLVILFYILYLIFFLYNLFKFKFNSKVAYQHIPFEKEAYENENDENYLANRKAYSWVKYI